MTLCHLNFLIATICLIWLSFSSFVNCRLTSEAFNKFVQLSSDPNSIVDAKGTKWAVLVAGSNLYANYRHQADICHAYQIMRKGGLKDENIIVFMYDDIAFNKDNPKQGVIINSPRGKNVYPHVIKDYTGENVTASNVLGVILGAKWAVRGGSGKVLKSGPNDHVFIYYSDHGAPGILGMPGVTDPIYANDLVDVLKKKHAYNEYKSMVIYIEACEAGSMFDGLLPDNLNIYVTTASNPDESSYATYCGKDHGTPSEYSHTCLGDLYSVSWMEDSDKKDPRKETLEQQYTTVKKRTKSSHVMEYGDIHLREDYLALYFVSNSSKQNQTYLKIKNEPVHTPLVAVEQREADLIYFEEMVRRAPEGSKERIEAQKTLDEVISQRKHADQSVQSIAEVLSGGMNDPSYLTMVRPAGKPLVDDWDCLKAMVKTYEAHCGPLRTYGKKYMRAFANFCNAGISEGRMAQISGQICAI